MTKADRCFGLIQSDKMLNPVYKAINAQLKTDGNKAFLSVFLSSGCVAPACRFIFRSHTNHGNEELMKIPMAYFANTFRKVLTYLSIAMSKYKAKWMN